MNNKYFLLELVYCKFTTFEEMNEVQIIIKFLIIYFSIINQNEQKHLLTFC